ncbi:hypothetical protein AB1Y20_010448 [Prymnesium parvum]|uniref:Protein kinase domain-containing protein n=2 Tax=Prymnesium parvum TaxID=97485 RepID=A0AB34INQ3_PRYPA
MNTAVNGPVNFRRSSQNTKSLAAPFQGKPASNSKLTFSSGQEQEERAPPPHGISEQQMDDDDEPEEAARPPAFDLNGPVEAVALHSDWQFWNVFSDVRTIGKGHFAKVKHVKHNESREDFAAKILDKSLADNDLEDLVREFQMLRALRHDNIIRLFAAFETPRKLYLITELATGGELMKRLGDDTSVYSEDHVRYHVQTILEAIEYMHAKHCVHRDLKPENVLLSDNSPDACIKIVDLGLSRFFEEDKVMRTICGTHKYLAPELVQTDRGQLVGYDKAIDMWGVGLLTFIMLFGFNPFARDSQRETHNAIVKAEWKFPQGWTVSPRAMDFISGLLIKSATSRMTASQALAHRWLDLGLPPSPNALMSSDPKRPVKQMLREFNAQRMLSKVVKGTHRRLGKDAGSSDALPAIDGNR